MNNKVDKKKLLGISPNSNKFKEYKRSLISLSDIQKQASIGLMLGDASLQTQNKGKNYRMKFEWSNKNLPYVTHVYNLFSEWVIADPHKKTRTSPKGNKIINWGFQTISHEAFNFLATLFIDSTFKKGVTKEVINTHLTEIGLAYWFMDDGGKLDYNPNSKNKSIVLNTQSFTNEDVNMMKKELDKKWGLDCEVRTNKQKKIIVIRNYDTFISLTGSHIIPEMKYKLPKE